MRQPKRASSNSDNTKIGTNPFKDSKFLFQSIFWAVFALISISILFFLMQSFTRPPMQDKITIGVLMISKEEELSKYQELADYLSNQSRSKFVIDAVEIGKANV